MSGDHIDLTSDPGPPEPEQPQKQRRFIGMQFSCCSVYSRIYINKDETAYVGNCPKCAKRVSMKIGPGGTDSRFFTSY